ncbi:hypothetical protein [Cellulomonas sp. S1-8]|uniref:hypothetical protein n=1 Tax=Cellulomonas sp. S1-8 TaxID=2904790 RepID=UPI002244D59C|nr:hypothetical protein [Cellulomonas sp. S1-8]UZN02147.1 hypothetical protein OKX07_13760 [Cellulomonas sp. S1-8]
MSFVRLAVMAVMYAFGACLAAWAAGMMAVAGLPLVAALVLKALLVALVLVVVTWRGMGDEGNAPRHVVLVALAATVGFAADPFTWAARTFLGQLVVPAGPVALALDLVVWLLVVVGTATLARSRRQHGREVAYA